MQLPATISSILTTLHKAGFEAYVVGGSVRDLLLHTTPKDWDITTSASPEEIQQLFPKHFYANAFGTVTVLTGSDEVGLKEVEVTTYRTDGEYTDQRHPNEVAFTKSLTEDLARRDFTINAMAMAEKHSKLEPYNEAAVAIEDMIVIDPFGGIQDLHTKVIRAVGDPNQRFQEDALRLLRAVRFVAQLNFTIEEGTQAALTKNASALEAVSHERIRDELVKMVMGQHPEAGFNLLQQTGLLSYILPELMEGVGVGQNKHHIYTVFEHCVKSLQFAVQFDYSLPVRLAALFHDIGKPRTKRKQGDDYTFYAHEIVGAQITEKLMKRLKFDNDVISKVVHLVRHHMFYYDVGKVTEAGARRLLRRVGKEHFDDLIKLRIAERKGSGVPKAEPYRLRHLQFMVEKASKEPISVGQLAISGSDLMEDLSITPGPIIGGILNALLAEVIEDPAKNTKEFLLGRAKQLQHEDPKKLKELGLAAAEEKMREEEEDIKRKYHV